MTTDDDSSGVTINLALGNNPDTEDILLGLNVPGGVPVTLAAWLCMTIGEAMPGSTLATPSLPGSVITLRIPRDAYRDWAARRDAELDDEDDLGDEGGQ